MVTRKGATMREINVDEIREIICDDYCKYLDEAYCRYKDPDEAREWLEENVCEGCPLGSL